MSTMSYRPRDKRRGKTVKQCFSVSEATIQGLDKIREAFHRRYPLANYPTLSAVLEQVIAKDLTRLGRPEELAAEINDFERRYPKGTKPFNEDGEQS